MLPAGCAPDWISAPVCIQHAEAGRGLDLADPGERQAELVGQRLDRVAPRGGAVNSSS